MFKKCLPVLIFLLVFTSLFFFEEEKKSLTLWGFSDRSDIFEPLTELYAEQNPGFELKVHQYAKEQEYKKFLLEKLKDGKGPDIFFFSAQEFDYMKDFLAPSGVSMTEGFFEGPLKVVRDKNLSYGMPYFGDPFVLMVNQRYFSEGVPSDWTLFAEKTRTISIPGIAFGTINGLRFSGEMLTMLSLQQNDPSLAMKFFLRFSDPKDRYFNWREDLSKRYEKKEVESFIRGQVASIGAYASMLPEIKALARERSSSGVKTISADDIQMVRFPHFGSHEKYLAQYWYLGVNRNSSDPKTAWDFIRFLAQDKNIQYYELVTKRPILKKTGASNLFQGVLEKSEWGTVKKDILRDS